MSDEKNASSSFYWATWRGSEVQRCSRAAKGLWIDVLCEMHSQSPQGVFPSDPADFCELMGDSRDPEIVAIKWREYGPLLEELERHKVFSWGRNYDKDLDPDAIVNRRMYRDWLKSVTKSQNASRAANIRWGKDPGEKARKSHAKHADPYAEPDADPHAKAMRNVLPQRVTMDDVRKEIGCAPCAEAMQEAMPKTCHSDPIHPENRSERGIQGPSKTGEILRSLGGNAKPPWELLYDDIYSLTMDGPELMVWWNRVIEVFKANKKLDLIEEHVKALREWKARGDSEPKNKGAVLTRRVQKTAKKFGLTIPEPPKKAEVA